MKELARTNAELLEEISHLKQRVKALEQSESELKCIEQSLLESMELYRQLAVNFPNGSVSIYNKELRVIFVAGQELTQSGRTADFFIGKHFNELAPPETFRIAEPYLRAAFAGKVGAYETLYYDQQFYHVVVAPLRGANHEVELIMVVSLNITERLRAEEELWRNQQMLRQILDTIPQSIFWKDKTGKYLGCNKVFAQASGFDDPAQIIGKTDFDLPWPKADAEAYREDDGQVIASGKRKLHIIEPLQQADGVRLWIDTSKMPLLDSKQEIRGVLGVYENITDRKRAEEALHNLYQLNQEVILGSAEGIVVYDREMRYLLWNPFMEALTGVLACDILGKRALSTHFLISENKVWIA
ncbi:MAG: hypothetical protein CSYNP_01301 [Syntrophus sp. SKADARSKE-3]|nr:hypothetical protein [Syntrophus sp. SKADARSKE-3]